MKKIKLKDLIKEKYNLEEKEAIGYILSGNVLVDEKKITKTGILIEPSLNVRIKSKSQYVSRGAYKLKGALNKFNVNIDNKICIDCGSSTGGFTQILLENGAKKVYAVDCGSNLIHYTLRNDERVVIMENHKVNELKFEDFDNGIDIAVMDISFSSSIGLIDHLFNKLAINSAIVLIKPQFEYNRLKDILSLTENFNGIIKDEIVVEKIVNHIIIEIRDKGLDTIDKTPSSIKGAKGNLEYFLYIGKKSAK